MKRAIEGDIDAANNNELATASSPTAQNRWAKADLKKKLLETEAKTERLAQELNAAAQREIGLLEELAICRSENTCVAARERAAQNATLELRKLWTSQEITMHKPRGPPRRPSNYLSND